MLLAGQCTYCGELTVWIESTGSVRCNSPRGCGRTLAGPRSTGNHAVREEGDCASWCDVCSTNVSRGLNPDGTMKERRG